MSGPMLLLLARAAMTQSCQCARVHRAWSQTHTDTVREHTVGEVSKARDKLRYVFSFTETYNLNHTTGTTHRGADVQPVLLKHTTSFTETDMLTCNVLKSELHSERQLDFTVVLIQSCSNTEANKLDKELVIDPTHTAMSSYKLV